MYARLSATTVPLLAITCSQLLMGHVGCHETHELASCTAEDRGDVWQPGLTKEGTTVMVTIDDSDPSAPAEGGNRWQLSVRDLSGRAVDDAIVTVGAFISDHGHGTGPVGVRDLGDGRYDAGPIEVTMPGLWTIDVQIDRPEVAETVSFSVCIEG